MEFSFYQGNEEEWDLFISKKSMNGIFLQTRKFINYHTDGKFKDCSVCVRKGKELVAAVLACEVVENAEKVFYAHKGTTFGGITISKNIYTATLIDQLISGMIDFLKRNQFTKIYLKMVPDIYQMKNADLIDYFLYKYNFNCFCELNYYLKLDKYKNEITTQFTASKRRDYRYSLKNNFEFRILETKEEINMYYNVLLLNLKKLNLNPVHSLEDLYDLKFNRFYEKIEFYGVFFEDKVVAGSMLFYFGDDIVHTQYLSSNQEYLSLFPMDFLIYSLIKLSLEKDKKIFSFGICTENQGKYLNLSLSRFKEGFGTDFCINRSYEKRL
mgnify:CR=1 FL=1